MLGWLLRVVVITIVVNFVWRLLFSGKPASGRAPVNPAPGGERTGGALVRDPHCGTYVTQSRAIRVGSGDRAQYFCSDNCRTAYLAAHPQ